MERKREGGERGCVFVLREKARERAWGRESARGSESTCMNERESERKRASQRNMTSACLWGIGVISH